jgi:asparagine synthase (glutamine-hydrolysing)
MCGIAGYFGNISRERLALASRWQAHRGPDGDGLWFDSACSVGLAHRRLAIIDLSPAGAQPMTSADGAVVLTYNGEIYNYRELRAELETHGHHFRGHSDTEVLLELYLAEGEAALARLNGIFAFALWDSRHESLFIARDALGVKPLYYAESDAGFAFASELKALLCMVPAEGRELDISALHRYLTFLWCPGEGTLLRGVRKLGPGEALLVRVGGIARHWSWYRLPVFRGVTADPDTPEGAENVAASLRRAVHRQLVADVPVGAFLSGGLDSSSIVAFAREQVADIRCFTIDAQGRQDSGTADDLPYARQMARYLGVPLEVVSTSATAMADDFEALISRIDEPLADPASLNVFYICRLARQQGMKVLLSGAGGDDLFAGYRRHLAVNYEYLWSWLPARWRAGIEQAALRLDQRNAAMRRLARAFNGAGLEGDERLVTYFTWARAADLFPLYTRQTRAALRDETAAAPLLEFLRPLPAAVKPLDRMLALEQRFFLADHNLAYTDRMSMAASVEVRVPFLDLDLVERAARIPFGQKQKGREGKWVLKQAMRPYLPADVIHRPKTGFGAPLRRWIRSELREWMNDVLSAESLNRRGLFVPAAVQQLIDQNYRGERDAAYTLWSLLTIEMWCRKYLDDNPVGTKALNAANAGR